MGKKKFYQTDEFKKSYDEWNQKLKASGFEGEILPLEEDTLVRNQYFDCNRKDANFGVDYYGFCQQILREYDFGHYADASERELFNADIRKLIFEQHSEGQTERQIETYLRENTSKKLSQQRINQIVNEIKSNFLRMKK